MPPGKKYTDATRRFDRDQMFALDTTEAEFGGRGGAVREQPGSVVGVHPRPGDHPGAVAGTDLVLEHVDDGVDRVGRHKALLDQQRLEGPGPKLSRRRFAGCVVGGHADSK